jgi:hypothetical protein
MYIGFSVTRVHTRHKSERTMLEVTPITLGTESAPAIEAYIRRKHFLKSYKGALALKVPLRRNSKIF